MRRRTAWRRILQGGVGTSGWMAAFLLGMAAAMFLKLMSAGGGVSETGASHTKSDGIPEVMAAEASEAGSSELAGRPRMPESGSGNLKHEDGVQTDGAVGQAGDSADGEGGAAGKDEAPDEPLVRVYLAEEGRVETVPLETYVLGVVAGEMPADFELEALKAQAIAARTYIIRKLFTAAQDTGDVKREYDVTDGEADQVYVPLKKIREMRLEREEELARIGRAVAETQGLVLTYEGEPIQAAYFSTSGGYTENAEDYWSVEVPYLRSVPSPWDAQLSPRFEQKVEMELDEFYDRLDIRKRDRKGGIEVLSRTAGRSVKEIRIGKKVLTGREVREALDLPSANFSWRIEDGRITLVCYGYGHGVGMSQWGAQALARAGNDAEQILAYYYRGTRLVRSASLAASFESFKT
ncbi:Stage II sporulation protein D [Thermobacillus xylanilyticus]|uniref:Stage II sporulation protein D n=1 Tax=Thermobacillus xylanilyticus TaxID=76633 RepID=A0ABN7S6D1_THEXY|nr:stage II sporulation protein D [Thermobacillus xylanilyticus]CAG5091443.1 Stage II sporulation protein D [Thermobacillus xylanilyticus]